MLSNTATPRYYGEFRDKVLNGEIPVNREISMEMNRIDWLIANPGVYYDDEAVEGWIAFCEDEMVLTDGSNFGESNYLVGSITLKNPCMNQMLLDEVDIL